MVHFYAPRDLPLLRAVLWSGDNIESVEDIFAGSSLVRKISAADGILQISDSSHSEWFIRPGHYVSLSDRISVYTEVDFQAKFQEVS